MRSLFFAAAFCAAVGLSAAEVNLALNQKASASSEQADSFGAKFAVDGKKGTRWSSKFSDAQNLTVDLGTAKTVGKVVILWENAYGKQFKVQLSNDGKVWKDAAAIKDGKGKTQTISFAPEKAKFVRILCEKRGTKFGYSIYELEVYPK